MNIFRDSERGSNESYEARQGHQVRMVISGVAFAIATTLGSCTVKRVTVDAGEEAVLIEKPILFGSGWVQKTPLTTGSAWIWNSTQNVIVDIRPLQKEEKFDDIITSDNVPVDFSGFIKMNIIPGSTPELIEKLSDKWYDIHVKQIFRTSIRDAIAKYSMTELTTRQSALDKVQKEVFIELKNFIDTNKIPVVLHEVIIGKVTPPETIVQAIAQTAAQQQRSKTMVETAKAEVERADSEKKRAQADNAYREAMKLSPEQFVQLEGLRTQREIATSCANGKACTLLVGNMPGATVPLK